MHRANQPRVSEVLDLMPGCKVEPRFASEETLSLKARFGTAAHRLFAYAARNAGDWKKVEARIKKMPPSPLREHAWAVYRFLRDTNCVPLFVERRITTEACTGQPDIIARHGGICLWIIDFKTGKINRPRHEVQLAAYSSLEEAAHKLVAERWSVVEVSSGRYRVVDVPESRIELHRRAFLAACDLWAWSKSQK